MEPYIFTQRNGIHILDLRQTLKYLNEYYDWVRDLIADGGSVMFVGTKRQAQEIIAREAGRCGMPYVTHRWLGGTLTNWRTIRERIDTLKKLEARRDKGEFELITKREAMMLNRKIAKLQIRLGGIRDMKKVPNAVIVVDTRRETTAVKEANILNIPVIALMDTNCDPDMIEYVIPANDDAMRSINLMMKAFADAVLEGKTLRASEGEEEEVETGPSYEYFDEDEDDDEAYLGASTLAKLRDSELFDDDDDEDDDVDDDSDEEETDEEVEETDEE